MNQMGHAAGQKPSLSGRLSPVPILQVATGFWASQALLTAVEFRVFTLLFPGPKSAAELAAAAGADVKAMEALLDANCAIGFLQRQGDRYKNVEVANAFLVESVPGNYVDMVRFMRDPLYPLWSQLRDRVRAGSPPTTPQGTDELEIGLARAFHTGAYATMTRVAEILDLEFSDMTRLLEMGSHTGASTLCLARRYPQLHGTLIDRPIFQALAEEYAKSMKLEERVRFVPGDPDAGQPGANADLVLIAHHLSRRTRAAIPLVLAAARASLREGGAIIVTEFLLEDSHAEPREAALYRLNVLAAYGAGNAGALTRGELTKLLQEAGFVGVDMVGLPMFGITAITATKG
jgi:predicted O-methyltransferase YrrM